MTDKTIAEMTSVELIDEIQRLAVEQDRIRSLRYALRNAMHMKMAEEETAKKKATDAAATDGVQHAVAEGANLSASPVVEH